MFTTGCSSPTRTAELSGLCAPLGEATMGGRGSPAWLLLFVEKLLEWVRQRVVIYPGFSLWAQLSTAGGAFLACLVLLHLPKATQAIRPKESGAPGTSTTGSHSHSAVVLITSQSLGLCVSKTGFLCVNLAILKLPL